MLSHKMYPVLIWQSWMQISLIWRVQPLMTRVLSYFLEQNLQNQGQGPDQVGGAQGPEGNRTELTWMIQKMMSLKSQSLTKPCLFLSSFRMQEMNLSMPMILWDHQGKKLAVQFVWITKNRYRGVGDSWSLQCVAMCSVSLVSKHPSQLIDVVQPAGRSWPSDKSTLCIYDVYKWWQYESACKHFTFDILSVFVDMLVLIFTSCLFV